MSKDVHALRPSLPVMWLNRSTALLALFAAFITAATKASNQLELFLQIPIFDDPYIRIGVFSGSLIVIGLGLVQEMRVRKDARRAQELAFKVDSVPSGFFRIGPYQNTPEDLGRFTRADKTHEKVLAWVRTANALPLFLSGVSGAGKTSLLDAFVLPRLRADGWDVLQTRVFQDPIKALQMAFDAEFARKKSPRASIQSAAQNARARFLIVLDQFEEFLILTEHKQRQPFLDLLDDLHERPIKNFLLLLVIRADYEDKLDELELPRLRLEENHLKVGAFTLGDAKRFFLKSGLVLENASLDQLLVSAAHMDDTPGLVRPITLNVLGKILYDSLGRASTLDAEALVRDYLKDIVEQRGIRDQSPKVLSELVTDQLTACSKSETELAEATRLRRAEVRAVLGGLAAGALARPLDGTQDIWALSHDFVARVAVGYLRRRRPRLWRVAVSYSAPALLIIVLLGASGALYWEKTSLSRTKLALAKLNLAAFDTKRGIKVVADPALSDRSFLNAEPLLRQIRSKIIEFDMENNENVTNFTPISLMTSLHKLNLSSVMLYDLRPLETLKSLTSLMLDDDPITDLEPLVELNDTLNVLSLKGLNETVNLAPLNNLKNLTFLDLSDSAVDDRSLENNPKLKIIEPDNFP